MTLHPDIIEGLDIAHRWPLAGWKAWDHGDGQTSQKRALHLIVENLISLVWGGNKSGKTELNLAAGCAYAMGGDHPAVQSWLRLNGLPPDLIAPGPGTAWFLAPTFEDSKRYHRERVSQICGVIDDGPDWALRKAGKEATLEFSVPGYKKKAKIVFKAHSQGVGGMKGDAIRYLGVDEECPEPMFNQALLRLGEDFKNRAVFSMTPDVSRGISWVKPRFIDKKNPHSDHVLIKPADNPNIPDGMLEALAAGMSKAERDAAIDGSFGTMSGLVYPRFSRGIHTIADREVPEDWARYAGQDFGMDSPNATIWGAVSPDGWVEVYREFVINNKSGSEVGALVNEICEDADEYVIHVWCDPSNLQTTRDFGLGSGMEASKAYRDVEHGITAVKVRLAAPTVRLRIHRSCVRLITELESYRRGKNGKPIKRNDHCVDALRYLIKGIDSGREEATDWASGLDLGELEQKSAWKI